jgi:hypothetical protein
MLMCAKGTVVFVFYQPDDTLLIHHFIYPESESESDRTPRLRRDDSPFVFSSLSLDIRALAICFGINERIFRPSILSQHMASTQPRRQCGSNDSCKQPAAAHCEECSQAFCIKHLLDHRQVLDQQMTVIIDEHDQLQHTLSQQAANPESHPCFKAIDQWNENRSS